MAKVINLYISDKRFSLRINEYAGKVYLRELARKTYGDAIKKLEGDLDARINGKLRGTLGADAQAESIRQSLTDIREKYASVLKDPKVSFEWTDADTRLYKGWKSTLPGLDGQTKRCNLLAEWLKYWGFVPEGDAVRDLEARLSHDTGEKIEKWQEGKSVKQATLNRGLLYKEMYKLHFEAGLIKEGLCPQELRDIWAQEKKAAEARKVAKKAAKAKK